MYYLDSAGPHQDFCLAHFYNLLHQINYVCMYVCMYVCLYHHLHGFFFHYCSKSLRLFILTKTLFNPFTSKLLAKNTFVTFHPKTYTNGFLLNG